MELKKITKAILFALPIFTSYCYISKAYADYKEKSHSHEANTTDEIDPSAVTLEAMVISSGQAPEAFESIKLIKKDLGIATDGADVLKQTPGIAVTRQGGTASDPVLRGLGGTRLNISIDGVPFGGVCNHRMDPATAYVSPGSFDGLILLKGPQSVTNGNNISGTVNFERAVPRYEEIGARAYGSYLYGSFNQQALSVDSSVGFEKGFVSYTHNNTSGDNYVDGDGNEVAQTFYDTSNDRGAIGYTPDEDTLLEFSGLTSNGVIGNATIHMDVTKLDRQNYDLHFKKENISSWLQEVDLRYNFTEVDHDMDNFTFRSVDLSNPDIEPPDYILMQQFWRRHYAKAQLTSEITPDIELTSGIDYRNDSYDGSSGDGRRDGPPPDSLQRGWNRIVDFDNIGAYIELKYQMNTEFRWVTGFRIDSLGTSTGNMHRAAIEGDYSHEPEDKQPDSLVGANKFKRQSLFAGFLRSEYAFQNLPIIASAGYGHAERAPDYWEVYSMDAFFLNPEKNNEIDAQISYQGDKFSVELSAFYSHITDFILVKGGAEANNINAQRTGTEFLLAYYLTDEFSMTGNLSYVYGQNLTQHKPLAQTPPLEGNIGFQYDDGVFYGAVNTRLVARQDRIHPLHGNVIALDTTPTAGFVTASLQLGYTPHPLVKFQFGIDNLFNKQYSEHINRSAATLAQPTPNKLIEPGRAYWGRITIDFDYPASFK